MSRTRRAPAPAPTPCQVSSWLPPSATLHVVDGPRGETALLVEVLGAREALPVGLLLHAPRWAWLDLCTRAWAQHARFAGLEAAIDAIRPVEEFDA